MDVIYFCANSSFHLQDICYSNMYSDFQIGYLASDEDIQEIALLEVPHHQWISK